MDAHRPVQLAEKGREADRAVAQVEGHQAVLDDGERIERLVPGANVGGDADGFAAALDGGHRDLRVGNGKRDLDTELRGELVELGQRLFRGGPDDHDRAERLGEGEEPAVGRERVGAVASDLDIAALRAA